MPKNLSRLRTLAATNQSFRCCYCQLPLWHGELRAFMERFGLSERQAKLLQCTAEHLTAQSDGGPDTAANIAAACWLCNNRRHRYSKPLDPPAYRRLVQSRIGRGAWFPAAVTAKLLRTHGGTAASSS